MVFLSVEASDHWNWSFFPNYLRAMTFSCADFLTRRKILRIQRARLDIINQLFIISYNEASRGKEMNIMIDSPHQQK